MATDRTPTIEEVGEGLDNLLDFIYPGSSDESAIRSLNNGSSKSIDLMTENDIKYKEAIILRTEQELLKEKNNVKKLEERIRQLEESFEKEKKNAENGVRAQITPELIREYKRNHYCCVCEKSAAFVCCLHTSYCSSNCQARHAEHHQRFCSKSSNFPPVFSVRRVRRVITSASATIISTNSEGCDSRTMTTLTHHKKVGIKRVACTSPPDNSDDSHSSKSKRCDH